MLTPKLTISATYICKIPVVKGILNDTILSGGSQDIVKLKDSYNSKRPINYEYKVDEFIKYNSVYEYAKRDFVNDLELEVKRLRFEKDINERIFKYYDFSNEEIDYIYSKVGANPYDIDDKTIVLSVNELDKSIEK
ncbi:hypothetical protein GNF64_15600, partial [Clostridium perfringens]|nr:hypothetical protein [Clostridium perfringens]